MIDTTLCYIKKEGSWLLLFRNKKENDRRITSVVFIKSSAEGSSAENRVVG